MQFHMMTLLDALGKIIRIYHECEDRIEKSVPEDHRLASRGLPNDDKTVIPRDGFFLSYPHTNNKFFFLLATVFIYL